MFTFLAWTCSSATIRPTLVCLHLNSSFPLEPLQKSELVTSYTGRAINIWVKARERITFGAGKMRRTNAIVMVISFNFFRILWSFEIAHMYQKFLVYRISNSSCFALLIKSFHLCRTWKKWTTNCGKVVMVHSIFCQFNVSHIPYFSSLSFYRAIPSQT